LAKFQPHTVPQATSRYRHRQRGPQCLTTTVRRGVSIVSPLGSGFVIILTKVDHLTLSRSRSTTPTFIAMVESSQLQQCASADKPTRRQATTDQFVSMTRKLGGTALAGLLSTTRAMREVRPPQIDKQTLTYHFQNSSLSSGRAHTSTRSRDVRFSELEWRHENGE